MLDALNPCLQAEWNVGAGLTEDFTLILRLNGWLTRTEVQERFGVDTARRLRRLCSNEGSTRFHKRKRYFALHDVEDFCVAKRLGHEPGKPPVSFSDADDMPYVLLSTGWMTREEVESWFGKRALQHLGDLSKIPGCSRIYKGRRYYSRDELSARSERLTCTRKAYRKANPSEDRAAYSIDALACREVNASANVLCKLFGIDPSVMWADLAGDKIAVRARWFSRSAWTVSTETLAVFPKGSGASCAEIVSGLLRQAEKRLAEKLPGLDIPRA